MNAIAKIIPASEAETAPPSGLALLRAPFPANQISKLPKPYKKDSPKGKCSECGGYHGLPAVHLDYVGHAALTDRLLDCDPGWTWEPVADPASYGLPVAPGGMWIRLTVCGVTRYGFGHPDGKGGGDAVKETIGDALRNAAMRFGAALDLWHKGDLHAPEEAEPVASAEEMATNLLRGCGNKAMLQDAWNKNKAGWKGLLSREAYARLIGIVTECVEAFNAEEREAEPATNPEPPPVDDGDVFGDDIPF